jgi:hypothetical protein
MPMLQSSQAIWVGLYALHTAALAGGALLLCYSLFPLRIEKLEILYRIEGVQFMAVPPAVPPDKWQRMTETDREIIEPMADWIRLAAGATIAISVLSLVLLLRLSHHLKRPSPQPFLPRETGSDAAA